MRSTDIGLLMVRVVAGLTMAAHGTQYLFGWFGGGGLTGAATFFSQSGYRQADLIASSPACPRPSAVSPSPSAW
ncbi:DoxX family membrane protein [Kutzneria chonburiensis]|uniref:DoxX family membrane protein n=1 Tax=Kutzneria chonburiensis TaxID=1483604 RepID=A0ABV6MN25_9PSEU|nr:DoxX family membrane protein [Kutzneria chonburiensis]